MGNDDDTAPLSNSARAWGCTFPRRVTLSLSSMMRTGRAEAGEAARRIENQVNITKRPISLDLFIKRCSG
jgi:hypothetical protein